MLYSKAHFFYAAIMPSENTYAKWSEFDFNVSEISSYTPCRRLRPGRKKKRLQKCCLKLPHLSLSSCVKMPFKSPVLVVNVYMYNIQKDVGMSCAAPWPSNISFTKSLIFISSEVNATTWGASPLFTK